MNREERAFAAEHHALVIRFLKVNRLPAADWYDVVVFRYLGSVYRWFTEIELHYYSFTTVAFNAMRSAVGNERAKEVRRIKAISLDDAIPGSDGMTWADTITAANLDFINYG